MVSVLFSSSPGAQEGGYYFCSQKKRQSKPYCVCMTWRERARDSERASVCEEKILGTPPRLER